MAQQTINNGDTGLVSRTKINENFSELYAGIYEPTTEPVLSGSNMTLDAVGNQEALYNPRASLGTRTITTNTTLIIPIYAKTISQYALFELTGTIVFTMPNDVEFDESVGTWDAGLKTLTIDAGTTEVYQFSFLRDKSSGIWSLIVGGPRA